MQSDTSDDYQIKVHEGGQKARLGRPYYKTVIDLSTRLSVSQPRWATPTSMVKRDSLVEKINNYNILAKWVGPQVLTTLVTALPAYNV